MYLPAYKPHPDFGVSRNNNIQILSKNLSKKEVIRRSFLKCCISNALDGSEDYYVNWPAINGRELGNQNVESAESESETDHSDYDDSSETE